MGKYLAGQKSTTLADLMARKAKGEKISMITCYDGAFARLIDSTGIDSVLVGDSLGNVMLGHESTIPVTMADMVHHTSAVSRVLSKAFLIADMPFGSYATTEDALKNAITLVQQGGAQAVKLEGGLNVVPQVKAITAAGIPVVGHLGLTPQSVHALSGYRVQGRDDSDAQLLIKDAMELEKAGVAMLVMELIPKKLASEVTKSLKIPTIGIGAGIGCDGQVLVMHDLLGFDDGFCPKFLKRYANIGQEVVSALNAYVEDVSTGKFPTDEHSFS